MSIPSMDLAWIVVDDWEAAVKFYTEVVGLHIKEYNEEWGWAELQGKGEVRLGIGKHQEKESVRPGQNAVVTFTVEDLDRSKAEMENKGAVCVGPIQEIPAHVRMQLFQDLDGNKFQIVQMLRQN